MIKEITIPDQEYFGYGNVYSGSRKEFNYKISPKEDTLHSMVWYGKFCSEKSEAIALQDFPLDESGVQKLQDWLNAQYEEYLKHNSQ